MKKITLLLLTLFLSVAVNAQLSEDFEGATFPPTGWTSFIGANGLGTVQNWKAQVFGGTNKTAVCTWEVLGSGERSEDWLVTPQITVSATEPILYFDNIDSATTDYGSIYTVRVSTASQTDPSDFTIVDTQTELDIAHSQSSILGTTHGVNLTPYVGQNIYIAFVLEQNDGDLWRIDNVVLSAAVSAPNPVINPTPADGAVDVYVDPTDGSDTDTDPDNVVAFDWDLATTGEVATSFEIFLGDSPSTLVSLGTIANDNVNISGMEYSTLYYWQIVAKNSGGSAVGSSTWSFTTQADPLSVNDFEKNTFTHFYDNASNTLNLESKDLAFTSIEVYSILGQKALTKTLSHKKETINVSNLSTGVYLAKVKINGNYSTVKFIKE